MPRTKATTRPKQSAANVAATKRTRDSVTEEAMSAALRELDSTVESRMFDITLDYELCSEQLTNLFKDIRTQLGPQMLRMTLDAVAQQALLGASATADASALSNMTACGDGGSKRTPRDDEEESTARSSNMSSHTTTHMSRTGRPLGPLASAKAKSRRSRSAQNSTLSSNASNNTHNASGMLPAQRTHNAATGSAAHQSRSKFRTPAISRLQTMSVERQMAPVTPKMQPDRPLAMLRYQKFGETVISLSGSPVIAQGVTREGANINIPVANGIISVLPSAMSSVEPHFMSQLDAQTLQQLRMLQSNLNLMMSHVKD